MNNTMRYFCYHFKKNIIILAIMLVFCLLITGHGIHSQYHSYAHISNETVEEVIRHIFNLNVFSTCMMLMSIVMAALEFAGFTNKRNIDTWFSFPVDRRKLALMHALNGLLYILIVHLASSVCGFIILNKYRSECHLDMTSYWIAVIIVFLIGICFYGVCLFAFVNANNIFDGMVFIGLYAYLPCIIASVLSPCLRKHTVIESGLLGMLYNCVTEPQRNMTEEYVNEMHRNEMYRGASSISFPSRTVIGEWFWILTAILAIVGVFILFNRKKAEKIGGISDSWFGYRILIPMTSALLIIITDSNVFSIWKGIMIGLIVFIAYVVFRRGIRLRIPDIIVIVVTIVLAMIPYDYMSELKYILRFFI